MSMSGLEDEVASHSVLPFREAQYNVGALTSCEACEVEERLSCMAIAEFLDHDELLGTRDA